MPGQPEWRHQLVEVRGEMKSLETIMGGRWYHGTNVDLRPGDFLLPGCAANFAQSSTDTVSITSDYDTALYWAGQVSDRPLVYEIEPCTSVDVWRVTLGNYGQCVVVLEGRVGSARIIRLTRA